MSNLHEYTGIVGDKVISSISRKAKDLCEKRVLHINSTNYGGGVAEILNSLLPLMNNLSIGADWRILNGNPKLFTLTKGFHNALQGGSINLSEIK
jgi:trehalose synthase